MRWRNAMLNAMIPMTRLALLAPASSDAAIRCGSQSIEAGESALKVLKYCGNPVTGNPLFLESGEWTYNFAPDEFMVRVIVRSGKVERTETLGHGYLPPGEKHPSQEEEGPPVEIPAP